MPSRSAAILEESVCQGCLGTLLSRDDGSVTGTPGAFIPCDCATPCTKCKGTGQLYGLWVIDSAMEWYEEGWRQCYACGGDGNKPQIQDH